MGNTPLPATGHAQRLVEARARYFEHGERPDDLLDPQVLRSWERCQRFGLLGDDPLAALPGIDRVALKTEQERNRILLTHSRPIMAQVHEQIRDSGSMVILADANGLLLETVGDADFVSRADRVALSAGASWDETRCGTNAIGTALAEELPIEIHGGEHFLEHNHFLTCCASPIFGPDGRLLGVLDISGDYRSHQRHTLGLVRLSTSLVEKRLFESTYADTLLVCFHPRADFLGTPGEGLAAVSADGQLRAINREGLRLLGLRMMDAVNRDFSLIFENSLSTLVDRHRQSPGTPHELRIGRRNLFVRLRGQAPARPVVGRVFDEIAPARPVAAAPRRQPTLDTLNTGDPRLQQAIDRARRILGRDIPILIQGESGAGKEMFARAFHHSGPRHDRPFIALNCAAIPETLIESELFGYQGGAFTGARKEGAPGKILQADGGTLFLDEIGDMPPNLQARLLRVLQERCVTPLGSTQVIPVDISLVCATHRKLRDEVASGRFREDLYYRLNGLAVTLPPLRERSDLKVLVERLLAAEHDAHGPLPEFTENAWQCITHYPWPGNIRQLTNVLRVALALLDTGESRIDLEHLPEEMTEAAAEMPVCTPPPPTAETNPGNAAGSLAEAGRQLARRTLEACDGNLSAAARRLGISRNTLYRKLGRP